MNKKYSFKKLSVIALGLCSPFILQAQITPTKIQVANFSDTDTSFPSDVVWYRLRLNGMVLQYTAGEQHIPVQNSTAYSGSDNQLWCVAGNQTDGYRIYNKAAGISKVLSAPDAGMETSNGEGSKAILTDLATAKATTHNLAWDFWESKQGSNSYINNGDYFLSRHGKNNNQKLNNRSNKLSFWTGGADQGSAFRFDQFPLDITQKIKVTKFEDSATAFPDSTHWYQIKLNGRNLAYRGTSQISNDSLELVYKFSGRSAELWCVAGDATNGYRIYNKAAGITKVLSGDTTGMRISNGEGANPILRSLTEAKGNTSRFNTAWDFSVSAQTTVGEFYLSRHGNEAHKMNNRQKTINGTKVDNIAYWTTGADAGSTFSFEEYEIPRDYASILQEAEKLVISKDAVGGYTTADIGDLETKINAYKNATETDKEAKGKELSTVYFAVKEKSPIEFNEGKIYLLKNSRYNLFLTINTNGDSIKGVANKQENSLAQMWKFIPERKEASNKQRYRLQNLGSGLRVKGVGVSEENPFGLAAIYYDYTTFALEKKEGKEAYKGSGIFALYSGENTTENSKALAFKDTKGSDLVAKEVNDEASSWLLYPVTPANQSEINNIQTATAFVPMYKIHKGKIGVPKLTSEQETALETAYNALRTESFTTEKANALQTQVNVALNAPINLPEPHKFYNVYSPYVKLYWQLDNTVNEMRSTTGTPAESGDSLLWQSFCFVPAEDGKFKLYNPKKNIYIGPTPTTSNTALTLVSDISQAGAYTIKSYFTNLSDTNANSNYGFNYYKGDPVVGLCEQDAEGKFIHQQSTNNKTIIKWNSPISSPASAFIILEQPNLDAVLFDSLGFATYSTSKAKQLPENVEVYEGKLNTATNKVKLTKLEGGVLPQDKGFVLKYVGESKNPMAFANTTTATDIAPSASNELQPATENVTKTETIYVLSNSEGQSVFTQVTNTTVPARSAYLQPTASNLPTLLNIVFNDEDPTTQIQGVTQQVEPKVVYDLTGRKVQKTTKGIYIINGKKIVL